MPSKLDLKHGKAQKHVKSMCGTHPSVKYYNSFSLLWASHVRVSELSLLLVSAVVVQICVLCIDMELLINKQISKERFYLYAEIPKDIYI